MIGPKVHFVRPELKALLPEYKLIRDAISGEVAIKTAGEEYLPRPNDAGSCQKTKDQRYKDYLKRAVYYNVTRRTLTSLVGQVFMREPFVEVPSILDDVVDDTTGTNISLHQLAKDVLTLTLAYSRCGLFVDYPVTDKPTTIKEMDAGFLRPTIRKYNPQEIINWRVREKGARDLLSLVVLHETYAFADDGFELKHAEQYRVLRLDNNGEYIQEIWREDEAREYKETRTRVDYNWVRKEVFKPLDARGKPFTEIPFTFVGTINNDSVPDKPNLYDIASLNIAHYRNSADLEEASFFIGQPTTVVTGLTEEWVENVLGGTINIGSRGGIPLPENATAHLLQPAENQMTMALIQHKERQMVALGAKLVEQQDVQRTAYEAKVETSAEGSILSSVTRNVQAAFTEVLEWCLKFLGAEGASFRFELNTDFDIARLSADEQIQAIQAWQAGALSFNEMRTMLRKAGVAYEEDDSVLNLYMQFLEDKMKLESKYEQKGQGSIIHNDERVNDAARVI